jgi:hypothetical protein
VLSDTTRCISEVNNLEINATEIDPTLCSVYASTKSEISETNSRSKRLCSCDNRLLSDKWSFIILVQFQYYYGDVDNKNHVIFQNVGTGS